VVKALEDVNLDGGLVITTPQEVSASVVRKELDFCRKTKLRVLGLVENMAGFVCPCCQVGGRFLRGDYHMCRMMMTMRVCSLFLFHAPVESLFPMYARVSHVHSLSHAHSAGVVLLL
jgi:Mrp family chromosome partitioning ATPase